MKLLPFHGKRLIRATQIIAITTTVLLISCGSGSGSGGNTTNSSPLEVTVEAASTLIGGESEILSASISNASGELTYSWDIFSGQENGEIVNGEASSATFVTFKVLESSTTVIELSVTDSEGRSASARHSIAVELGEEQEDYLERINGLEDTALQSCLLEHSARSVSELSSLNCQNRNIQIIEGLSQFSNLITINLSDNSITNLSELEGMPGIVHLFLSGNPQIEEYAPIGKLESLQSLSVSSREKELDFSFIEDNLSLETISINNIELEIGADIESAKRQASMILLASCPG